MTDVIRIGQFQYIHVLNKNTNVTRCLVGPCVFTRQEHESVLFSPRNCVQVNPRCYCRIRNPHIRTDNGEPQLDSFGQVRLRVGDEQIRFEQEPFPLQPGEELMIIGPLAVIPSNSALHIRCVREFSRDGKTFSAGHEYIFEGPGTYVPRVEEEVLKSIDASIILPNQALHLRALRHFTDRAGVPREAGEEWLVTTEGAYMPMVEEEVAGIVKAKVLTDKLALHVEASTTFTDAYKKLRRAGDQWLISISDSSTHMPDVNEKILKEVKVTTLNNRQFCVVMNPVDKAGKNKLGEMEIRKGDCSFFLHPGESLRNGIESIIVLNSDEAILLCAVEEFTDGDQRRAAGDRWLLKGPLEYIPPVEVTVVERRQSIPLDKNEGIYVRDETKGVVRSVVGQAYLLSEKESLWEKSLPAVVEDLLQRPGGMRHMIKDAPTPESSSTRDKTRVVRFNVQHNAAVQIYDYKRNVARIVFGPDLVMLEPDEQITVLSLSGDKPKIPNVVKATQLFMGPDFSSDVVIVETLDHARLQLKLSYNWHFEVDEKNPQKIFAVPDFVGDFCKAIASWVRGAVAAEDFDSFHRNSAKIIRAAVFGLDENNKVRDRYTFPANGLVITNIDIQAVEPTDTKTRDSLQKSVQLAIEITTKSQEATARHDNERKDQEAKGKLERQKLLDKIEAEKAKTKWLELQAESEAVQACGQAVAEAKARSESALIEADTELRQAQMKVEALKISAEAELAQKKSRQRSELEYIRKINELEVKKASEMATIEAEKLAAVMSAVGQETIVAIAQAGPEMQAKLLEGLGLKGYLITDGNAPINLFGAAQGMIGGSK